LLRLFLFFPILLLSQDIFTLPQEANHFIYTFSKELVKAEQEVYIFSSMLNEYELINALKKLSKKGVSVYIISRDLRKEDNKASYLSLLKGISLYILPQHKSRDIKGSLICIDNKKLYLSSESLDHASMYNNHAFVSVQQRQCQDLFKRMIGISTKIK